MRRLGILALVLGIVLAALLAAFESPSTHAQEADDATPVAPGVVFEPVAGDVSPPLVAAQAGVQLDWARFAPGARYAVPADDPSLLLVVVESGALTVRSSASLSINRAVALSAPEGETHETIAAGTETALEAGDSFVRTPNSELELLNRGGEPAVALTVSLAPGLSGRDVRAAATPVADRNGAGLVVALAVVVIPECPAGYVPAEIHPMATPGGGGGGGGAGGVAVAIAAAPECVGGGAEIDAEPVATPVP